MEKINRRTIITGLISLVAAPAIVRAGSLMPVRDMLAYKDHYSTVFDANEITFTATPGPLSYGVWIDCDTGIIHIMRRDDGEWGRLGHD